jgi:hypothetical protein
MSLYDVIAAGHRGQCFALIARRFMISEPQAALAVRYLLPAILPSFEAWASSRPGLAAFLDAMSRGDYEKALLSPAVLNNHFERERGLQLLDQFRLARELDDGELAQAVEHSGVTYRVLVQMLPFVTLFMMAGLRISCEKPFRDILAQRFGARRGLPSNPFAELSELVAFEAKGPRQGTLAQVLAGLFSRRDTEAARPAVPTGATPA